MNTSNKNQVMRIMHWVIPALAMLVTPASILANVNLRMQTDLGGVDLELFDTAAPLTFMNFMNYVSRGTASGYDGTFIHRSITDFVLQGGGYVFNPANGDFFGSGTTLIPVDPPVQNEPDPVNRPNIRGTLAMAKTPATDPNGNPIPGGGEDSATSQWFVNLEDNPGLDDPANNGGFTVFGRVLGNGMDVIDAIAAQLTCNDILPGTCGQFPETPIIGNDGAEAIQPEHLAIVNHVGFDQDVNAAVGDGVIDSLEDAAPNAGDGNSDGFLDSTQDFVASFPGSSGDYIVIEAPAANPLRSLDILGITFGLANQPAFRGFFDVLDFKHGFTGFELIQLASPAVTVTETLKAGEAPDTYYLFGPTSANPTPHWYEFLFDGSTGAMINGNVITLNFVDGERGDANPGSLDGVIIASPGGPAVNLDTDGDGIIDSVEDAAPNGGDANNDGTSDSTQDYVASFPDVFDTYIILETDASTPLNSVFLTGSDPGTGLSDGINFGGGFISFGLSGVAPGGAASVELTLAPGANPNAYYIFGPTPDNSTPHWYAFSFDAASGIGAEINDNVITLNLSDGARGDSDLDNTNGAIVVADGGPAFVADFDALDIDGDGSPDTIENGAPNSGDVNNDGVLDSEQGHVVSFTDLNDLYLSLVTDLPALFEQVRVLDGDILDFVFDPQNNIIILNGNNLSHGLLGFKISNINPGDTVTADLVLPRNESPTSLFNFGPTPANNVADWYEFLFDGTTGAVINENVITLNFIDGDRGDADRTKDGVIFNTGSAPGLVAVNTGAGGGGGCSIGSSNRSVHQAVDWWLVLATIIILRVRTISSRRDACSLQTSPAKYAASQVLLRNRNSTTAF
jgi:cyclophilin family peptidyl-prolyl cis-trans isomerase